MCCSARLQSAMPKYPRTGDQTSATASRRPAWCSRHTAATRAVSSRSSSGSLTTSARRLRGGGGGKWGETMDARDAMNGGKPQRCTTAWRLQRQQAAAAAFRERRCAHAPRRRKGKAGRVLGPQARAGRGAGASRRPDRVVDYFSQRRRRAVRARGCPLQRQHSESGGEAASMTVKRLRGDGVCYETKDKK